MKRTICSFLLCWIISSCIASSKADNPVILPAPTSFKTASGTCHITKLDRIRRVEDNSIPEEGYELKVNKKGVQITCSEDKGYRYALQTLGMVKEQFEGKKSLPCFEVKDQPRLKWRSFLLDSGRQYQQPQTIKKLLDLLFLLKINKFHWHLTEGLGWRLEIKKYPALTQKGAFVGRQAEQQGFYTQEEVKDLIRYAAERNIEIVPEIDMPGHSEAALVAYPQLSCFGDSVVVPEQGFTQHIFCAGKDSVLTFLKDVLDEVCELFPAEYIHLGGDEAPKGNWNKCSDCQQRIADLGLKDSHDLQLWFSAQMASYLKEKGKKVIFWGDVLYREGTTLPDNVTIHWWNWRGHKDLALKRATELGHPVIAGTNYCTYLNFPITPWRGYKQGRTFDISDIYGDNPSNIKDNPVIMGMSTALWTDDVVKESMIDQRILPRIFALSQQMWSKGEAVSFDDFMDQIRILQPFFESKGYEFGPALRSEVPADYSWEK